MALHHSTIHKDHSTRQSSLKLCIFIIYIRSSSQNFKTQQVDHGGAGKGGNKIVIMIIIIISSFDFNCSRDEQARCKRCVDMIIMMTAGDAEDAS